MSTAAAVIMLVERLPQLPFLTHVTPACAVRSCIPLSFPQLWLGGSPNQTRLAKVFAERVKLRDLESTLEPLLAAFKSRRQPGEAFGDFVARVGFAALRSYGDSYVPADKLDKLPTVSVL
jgi:hypothetical protein